MSSDKRKKKQPSNKNASQKTDPKHAAFNKVIDELEEQVEGAEYREGSGLPRSHIEDFALTIQSDLRKINNQFEHAHRDHYGDEPLSFSERLYHALKEPDSILAYTIAEMTGDTDFRKTHLYKSHANRALNAYVARPEYYDAVLGDMIPQKLRKDAAPRIAKRKYRDGTNGTNATALDDWEAFLEDFHTQTDGLPTGMPALDAALGGGFAGLTAVGGDESDGKTSMCLMMMMVAALRADPELGCVFFTIDQSKGKTLAKLLAHVAGVPRVVLKSSPKDRSTEENAKIKEARDELENNLLPRIRFVERTSHSRWPP